MPDPVCTPRPVDVDRLMHEATGASDAAHLGVPVPGPDETVEQLATAGEITAHVGAEVVEGLGVAGVGGGVALVAAPASTLVGGVLMWLHAYEEGERRSLAHDTEKLRGALAAFEGRADSVEARGESARSEGYAEGIRRVTAFAMREPQRFQQIATAVRSVVREGEAAVATGRDRGAEHERRVAQDPAYAHGVVYARRLRERDPEAFAARAEQSARLTADVARHRCTQPTRL